MSQSTDKTITVNPAYLDVALTQPGQREEIRINYSNTTDHVVSLDLFPIDLKQSDNGFITFINQNANTFSYSLSSFLTFETNRIDLEPGEKRDLIVTVTNREDISPGGHYAAVVARLIQTNVSTGEAVVAPSVSSLILLRKTGGERYVVSLKDTDWPPFTIVFSYPQSVTLKLQNDGNIHLIPYGVVTIRDSFGREIERGVINSSSQYIFPETRRNFLTPMMPVRKSFPISMNSLSVQGHDSLDKVNFKTDISFIYIHPAVIIGLIFLLSIIVYRIKRRRHTK